MLWGLDKRIQKINSFLNPHEPLMIHSKHISTWRCFLLPIMSSCRYWLLVGSFFHPISKTSYFPSILPRKPDPNFDSVFFCIPAWFIAFWTSKGLTILVKESFSLGGLEENSGNGREYMADPSLGRNQEMEEGFAEVSC